MRDTPQSDLVHGTNATHELSAISHGSQGVVVDFAMYLVRGTEKPVFVAQFSTFADAVQRAIGMADELGQLPPEYREQRPEAVDLYRNGCLELSIKIERGGLLGSKGVPKLRSI